MPVSDFFAPYIIGLRHHAFPMRSYRLPDRTTRRPPRSRRGVYVRAWGRGAGATVHRLLMNGAPDDGGVVTIAVFVPIGKPDYRWVLAVVAPLSALTILPHRDRV